MSYLLSKSCRKATKMLSIFIFFAFVCITCLPKQALAYIIPLEVGIGTLQNITEPYLANYMGAVYQFIIGMIGVAAVAMIAFGGLQWALAAGNQEQVTAAKKRVNDALIGLIIALMSYNILNLLNPEMVNYSDLEMEEVSYADIEDSEDSSSCSSLTTAGDDTCTGLQATNTQYTQANGSTTYLKLSPNAATAWDTLAAKFKNKYGKKVPVNHMFRTPEYQACLATNASADNPASKCGSPHVYGVGVDVNTSSLTQAEYNFLVCGTEATCSYSTSESSSLGTLNVVSYHEGWKVLNYNPDKDAGRRTEQHHFDYRPYANFCTLCPASTECGCS